MNLGDDAPKPIRRTTQLATRGYYVWWGDPVIAEARMLPSWRQVKDLDQAKQELRYNLLKYLENSEDIYSGHTVTWVYKAPDLNHADPFVRIGTYGWKLAVSQ